MEKPLLLTLKEWDSLADNIHEYLKLKKIIESGKKVALKNDEGEIYAYLQIDEIDKIRYIYKDFIELKNL